MATFEELRPRFLEAILAGERRPALEVAREALRQAPSLADLYVHLFQESMYEVGRRWETNAISIATEHIATAVTQYVLAQLYFDHPAPPATRGNLVITGIQGELHQVGAHIVADALEYDGWNVRLLGTDLPVDDILAIVLKHEASVLGISATMRVYVPVAARLIAAARERFSGRLRIIAGGGAFRSSPQLARQIGADDFALDVAEALEVLQRGGRKPKWQS
jgi:methanogenic corrinoid protein MtbC1